MKPLTVEIHGTGTHNRGAELMAIATGDRVRSSFPGSRVAVPRNFGDLRSRKRYGFLATSEFLGGMRSKAVGFALRRAGPSVRGALGFVDPGEVSVVLDASGFAFSDQWGTFPARRLLAKMNRLERQGQPLILLPQALGPFANSEVAAVSRELFSRADLVCARDEESYAHALPLLEAQKLRLYPDFTSGVRPILSGSLPLPALFCGIVPNCRMLDMTGSGTEYFDFLKFAIDYLVQENLNPAFILHDASEDRVVVEKLQERREIPVIEHHDPRVLKGILGRAELVIGSRFHGLVSTLSQGVPCIGVGWSHKYPELFREFEVPELLAENLGDTEHLGNLLVRLNTPEKRADYRARILAAGEAVKEKSERMWEEVEARIQERVPGRS